MFLCIVGAAAIGWAAPEGQAGPGFYAGVLLALAATLGWGAEGFLATSGMDLLDPVVALNVRQLVSGLTYLVVVLPLAGGYGLLLPVLTHPLGAAVAGVALLTTISYVFWYRGLNMTGVSRAMAMNITYSLWGIMFSALFTGLVLTANLTAGAALITVGMIMVVGNPRNMAQLRNVA
jgi:drug/metabolite transporter (DMT)-like permease